MNILCLGDSITYTELLPNLTHYPQILAETKEFNVINAGKAGSIINDVYKVAKNIIPVEYINVVTILVGINDLILGRSFKEIFSDYYKLITYIKKHDLKIIISTTPYIQENVPSEIVRNIQPMIVELNNLLNVFCYMNGIELVDNYTDTKDISYFLEDLHHLNDNGQRIIADNFYKALIKI